MAKDIVVFVPGIFGSRLRAPDGEEVWPPTVREAVAGYRRTARLLAPDLSPDGVVERLCVDVYGSLVAALKGFGYAENGAQRLLVLYAYDWRRDLLTEADGLDALLTGLVETHGADASIRLVCHSMGGLLTRACLEGPDAAQRPWAKAVKLAVFLATPHAGAPLAFARAIGVGGGSMGVSARDLRSLSADGRYPTGYQLWPPRLLQPIWDLESAVSLAPVSLFDPVLAGPFSLSAANMAAADRLHGRLDYARRPTGCRYFAVVSAAHETVTRLDKDLGEIAAVKVKATGDGTVPVTSAAVPPIQTAFVDANHVGVTQKPAAHQIIGMLLGKLASGPVIAAASGAPKAPTLSLSDTLTEQGEPVEIVITTPPRAGLTAEVRIARGGEEAAVPVATLQVEVAAPDLSRVALHAPPLAVGRHTFTLVVDGQEADEQELLVTAPARRGTASDEAP